MVRNHKNHTDNLRSINPLTDSQELIPALFDSQSVSNAFGTENVSVKHHHTLSSPLPSIPSHALSNYYFFRHFFSDQPDCQMETNGEGKYSETALSMSASW